MLVIDRAGVQACAEIHRKCARVSRLLAQPGGASLDPGVVAPTKPRLLVVSPPSVHADRWCEYFARNGFDVRRLDYGGTTDGAIPEPKTPSRLEAAMVGIRQLARTRSALRQVRPDLVQAHWLAGPGWLCAMVGARPLVVTAWGSDALIRAPGSLIGRLLTRLVAARTDAVTFDADVVRQSLLQLGVPAHKLHKVVIGADGERFVPGPRSSALLARLAVPENAFVVLAPRGLRPVYEPETVVRGFAEAELGDNAYLLLRIGSDGGSPDAVRKLAAALDVADRVVLYEGVDLAELPDLLRSSDVVVSVPSSDGTSVVLLEALLTERPVVVSDLPANREWVPDESHGRIVPVGDPHALAVALAWTCEHQAEAKVAAHVAAGNAREHGDAETEFARAAALYSELIAGRDAATHSS